MKYLNLALALSVLPALADIPPDNFDFPNADSDTPLSVTYRLPNGSSQSVQPGILFGINIPENEPTVALNTQNASSNSTYMLFMLDPDASMPENPTSRWIIHWWQANMTLAPASANDASNGGQRLINTTAPRVAYRRPRPPTNSSAHRYIQYVFRQPANFTIPPAFSGYGGSNSSRFPFEDFVDDADLDDPVAANYFFCTNQTAVPVDFVAAAGQQYPGGNGAMVTQGQNEPSRTSAGPSATGSASSTTSAAAGNILENRNSWFGMAFAFGAMAML